VRGRLTYLTKDLWGCSVLQCLESPTAAAALRVQRRKTIALHIGAVSVALAAVALIDPRKGNDLARMVDLLGIFAHRDCLRRDQGHRTPVHGDRVGTPTTHLRTHRRVPPRVDPTTSGVSAALPGTLPDAGSTLHPLPGARCLTFRREPGAHTLQLGLCQPSSGCAHPRSPPAPSQSSVPLMDWKPQVRSATPARAPSPAAAVPRRGNRSVDLRAGMPALVVLGLPVMRDVGWHRARATPPRVRTAKAETGGPAREERLVRSPGRVSQQPPGQRRAA